MIKESQSLIRLTPEQLEKLEESFPRLFYSVATDLVYEGHTPIVAVALLKGRIKLVKGRRVRDVLERGALLGVYELIHHLPFEHTVHILSGSEICYLDRSTLYELLNEEDHELNEVLEDLVRK